MGPLDALARAAQALNRQGEVLPCLELALNELCTGSRFIAAHLRLLRGDRLENSVAAGDAAQKQACIAPIVARSGLAPPGAAPAWTQSANDPRAFALTKAALGGFLSCPLDWGEERFGLLELFTA